MRAAKIEMLSWLKAGLLTGLVLFGLIHAPAQAETVMRVRGAITSFDGRVLAVKTREGNDLKVKVADDVGVSSLKSLQLSDIKQGSFVGATAVKKGPEGVLYAREVHVFPEEARGAGEGHREWDLEPGSTMTNANVDAIVETNDGKQLTLRYKDGMQKIIVPPGVPIVTFIPGDKSLLKAGAYVFFMAQQVTDGTFITQRIQVGKDGMKPPM